MAVVLAQLFDIQQQRLLLAEQAQEQRQQQEQQQLPGAFGAPALGPSAVAQALAAGGSLFEDGELPDASACCLRQRLVHCRVAPQPACCCAPRAERTRWRRQQALQVASQAELESLLLRVAALLEAAESGVWGLDLHPSDLAERRLAEEEARLVPGDCSGKIFPPPSCPSAEESIGGGDKSNHGRKKRLMGARQVRGCPGLFCCRKQLALVVPLRPAGSAAICPDPLPAVLFPC